MMNSLELKVPPLVVALICIFLMWIASRVFPSQSFWFPGVYACAIFLAVIGIVLISAGIASFRHAKTTVDPRKPDTATSLVRSGIYKRSRNPIYLGLLLILAGCAVSFRNYVGFAALPLFVLYMNQFQIRPEERALNYLFEMDFREYKNRVRRWL
jgi:protein-S-isoprenylcysteine O-methyltransferase Ste14